MSNWVDLKDEQPPIGSVLIVTVYDHCRGQKELRYPVYYMEKTYSSGYAFYNHGCEILLAEVSEVLAWMPMPTVWDGIKE